MLKIVGREADIGSIAPLTPGSSTFDRFGHDPANSSGRVSGQFDWIRQGAGLRFDSIELSVIAHRVTVTENAKQAREELAAHTRTTPDEVANSPHVLIGPTPSIVETLLDRRERHGISYIVFDSADLDAIEPVISELAGQSSNSRCGPSYLTLCLAIRQAVAALGLEA